MLLKLEPKHDYNGALPAQWRTMNAHKIHYNNNIIFYTRVPPLNTQINTTIKKGFSHELHWLWVQAKAPPPPPRQHTTVFNATNLSGYRWLSVEEVVDGCGGGGGGGVVSGDIW